MKRKIYEKSQGKWSVRVRYEYMWNEYTCRLYLNGSVHENADYFTNDKDDAIATTS